VKAYAVVGSGVGGSSIAAYLDAKGHDTVLFEKEPYLGGSSSTFSHAGYSYNTGATTLAGYQEGHIVRSTLDAIGCTSELIPTDPAIDIMQKGRHTPRYRDLERFLEVMDRDYPHAKNREFWTLVQKIGTDFYAMEGLTYSNRSLSAKLLSLSSHLPMAIRFQRYLRVDALSFIEAFFGDLSKEYLRFMEAQVLIVAQAKSCEINFFTAALALGYTFNETHYVPGGMGRLFDAITANMHDVRRSTTVDKIIKEKDHYVLHTADEVVTSKNSTVYDTPVLFEDRSIRTFYSKYKSLDNHQSSFMLYMTIESEESFKHHYQLIQDVLFPHTLSNALFVSFSDERDDLISQQGHYSITASIHTDTRWWEDKKSYSRQKKALQQLLQKTICDTLGITESQIVHSIAATPRTFKRYIRRSQLGGNAIKMKNLFPRLPGNDTPFKGLYHVGDTVYVAQGWPGVMLGVDNLRKRLYV